MKVQARQSVESRLQGKYSPYSSYTETDIHWLREIPSHWKVKRLRYSCSLNPSKSELNSLPDDTEVSFLPMEAIGEDGSLALEQTKPLGDVYQGYTYFRDGDVVVAKITPCFENGKGALCSGLRNGIGFGTTELHVLRPTQENDAKFLFYLTHSQPFRTLGERMMQGAAGQKRVPEDYLQNFTVGFPPLPEQRTIAAFLDRETARIDALIEKKQRLIDLLQEKRTALISHAVTKGLDPSVPMKDSGVEWLGEIPAHWEVAPLMYLTQQDRPIMYGIVLPGPNVENGVPIVKGGDVAPDRLRLNLLNRTTHEIESKYVRSRLRGNDIVYAIRGSIGMAEIVPHEIEGANLTQDAARVAPRQDLNVQWLLYALKSRSLFAQLDAGAQGATIRGINIKDLKRLRVPVPPQEEQDEIAVMLNKAREKVDNLVHKIYQGVQRLQEYRAVLISAAVTGKIDVRTEVALEVSE